MWFPPLTFPRGSAPPSQGLHGTLTSPEPGQLAFIQGVEEGKDVTLPRLCWLGFVFSVG
jgi:hypothetical protein